MISRKHIELQRKKFEAQKEPERRQPVKEPVVKVSITKKGELQTTVSSASF